MRILHQWLGAALAALFASHSAAAMPYTVTDRAGEAGALVQSAYSATVGSGASRRTASYPAIAYTFVHDLKDAGYRTGDSISSALLTIELRDGNEANGIAGNQDPENGTEWPGIEFNHEGRPSSFVDRNNIGQSDRFVFDLIDGAYADANVMAVLQSDGLLTVTLHAIQQSLGQRSGYFFASSVLDITADDGLLFGSLLNPAAAQTPEPSAIGVLGVGTFALALARRRRGRAVHRRRVV